MASDDHLNWRPVSTAPKDGTRIEVKTTAVWDDGTSPANGQHGYWSMKITEWRPYTPATE